MRLDRTVVARVEDVARARTEDMQRETRYEGELPRGGGTVLIGRPALLQRRSKDVLRKDASCVQRETRHLCVYSVCKTITQYR